jgi:hypothetical protein
MRTDWIKDHTVAVWVTGVGIIVLTAITSAINYLWPPDPDHPMGPHFLSFLAHLAPWLRLTEFAGVGLFCAMIAFYYGSRKSSPPTTRATASSDFGEIFDLHPTSLDQRVTDPSKHIYNTAKLRLYLTNKSAKGVQISAPKWLMNANEISVQCGASPFPGVPYQQGMLDFGYFYQLEEYLGSWKDEKWKRRPDGEDDELKTITVAPGYTFRIWIALNPCVPHSELEKRRKTRRLGTLILPISIGDQATDWNVPL